MKPILVRVTTVPLSLDKLLQGQLRYMGSYFDVIAVSSDEQYLNRVSKREECKSFHLEMTRKITPVKDLVAVFRLYFFLKKNKVTIIHTHTPKAGIVGMLASKLAGVPNRLHTVAGLPLLEAKGTKRKLLDFVETLTYSCATKVYPNSRGLADIILEQKYCLPAKVKVLAKGSSNGIDTSYFNISNVDKELQAKLRFEFNFSDDDFIFVFVGRIVGDKGINELIAAYKKVSAANKKVKLLLVGPFEKDLDPLQEDTYLTIKNDDSIVCVGYQNDVRPYYSISNALVFPSYREGFPNVVMQAGAMGLPSIVTDINGCNEIIEDGYNGLVIPVKDTSYLYSAMSTLLDAGEYARMATNSRPIITSRFEQKVVWQSILNEYDNISKIKNLVHDAV